MTAPKKDTVYIDVDDEITAIVEKVQDSKGKIVALVLPKRAAVLQSTVNMRLLKRAAHQAKKSLVLITSAAAILPLAGAVGVHVSKSLQSKPTIPPAPETKTSTLTINDEEAETDEPLDPAAPIGKLAGMEDNEPEETIDVDYDDNSEDQPTKKKGKEKAPNKKLKVPNFERFRLWIILGGVALLVILIGSIWAFYIAPRAKVVLKTDASDVTSTLDITASPSAKSLDKDKPIVRAESKQYQKTDTQKVAATGQKNVGNKATGTVTLTLTDCSQAQVTVPSGTAVSSNNLSFITQASATMVSTIKGGKCSNDSDASASVSVTAQNGGDQYNLSARSYVVGGASNVSASGSAMTGGTNKLVKVVSQQDFDAAKQQLMDKANEAGVADLKMQLSSANLVVMADTMKLTDQAVTAAPNIGDEAEETTVTAKLTYTMFGMNKDDVKQLVEADVKQKIDTSTQQILEEDDGLSKATIKTQEKKSNGDIPVNIQVQVSAGAKQDTEAIKKEIMGKKKGVALETLRKRPGIKDADIQYSPFWVFSTPKKASKITVVFEKADGSQ